MGKAPAGGARGIKMAGIKLGTIVLALAIVGMPFAASATEWPVRSHEYRTVHHWRAHHSPRVHYGYYWYRWGWRWGGTRYSWYGSSFAWE
jgi:hypothetical protein